MPATPPKPPHLAPGFGAQFRDPSIVAAYSRRPPYPAEVFDMLAEFAGSGPVLDLGAGTGDITLPLARRVSAIDAVEPSREMCAAAVARSQRDREPLDNVRWFECSAEEFSPDCPYELVVAGESLHWMEWSIVLPKLAGWLEPGHLLAIVMNRFLADLPWQRELRDIIPRYSTNSVYRTFDIGAELSSRNLFRERGRRSCVEPVFSQTALDYVESFHSRNGFSRDRMDARAVARFDAEVLALVLRDSPDGIVSAPVRSTVIWGIPLQAHQSQHML